MSVTYFKIQNLDNNTQEDKIFAIGKAMLEFLTEDEIDELVFDTYKDNEIAIAFLPEYKINRLRTVFVDAEIQKNKFMSDIFKDENALVSLEKFLRNNLTADLILDKISDLGVEFLTELDKEILSA